MSAKQITQIIRVDYDFNHVQVPTGDQINSHKVGNLVISISAKNLFALLIIYVGLKLFNIFT